MGSVTVRPVRSRRELKRFVDFPFRLHGEQPLWVPPLKIERRHFLSRRMNAFFTHGEAEYFLALRDGRVVGRISAQVNHAFNDYQGKDWGWFGFLEFEQDAEALQALLDAAAAWLLERGKERMVGPASFAMNDESGILIEGFDRRPMILEPWHPPYYQQLLEAAGCEGDGPADVEPRGLGSRQGPPGDLRAGRRRWRAKGSGPPMRRRQLRKDMDAFAEVYNAAWSKNWGFVPYSKKDLDAYAQKLQLVFDKNWFMIAERKDSGEVVGMAITVPDTNQVMTRDEGEAVAAGLVAVPPEGQDDRPVRVFLGVKPEYQHTGVAAKPLRRALRRGGKDPGGMTGGEMGWILETNEPMNRAMEGMGGEVVKRYRIFERVL